MRSSSTHRTAACTLAVLLACAATALTDGQGQSSPARQDDAEYAAELRKGEAALQRRQFPDALKAFRQANSLHDKTSVDAYLGMARAYLGLNAPKSAYDACSDALKLAGDDKGVEARIRNIRGTALVAWAESDEDRKVRDAEAEFRAVLALSDTIPLARYNLGVVLLKQKRVPDGVDQLQAFVERAGTLPEAKEARLMIENPRRASARYVPSFSVTTLRGEYLELDELKGKTVVLDFWGTWCGPCVAATPGLVRLNKKLKDQPVVFIGIAENDRDEKWRQFIVENKMDWPQVFDNGRLSRMFGITGYPTYIVIDGEGMVRARDMGYNPSRTDGWLESEIKKSLKATAK